MHSTTDLLYLPLALTGRCQPGQQARGMIHCRKRGFCGQQRPTLSGYAASMVLPSCRMVRPGPLLPTSGQAGWRQQESSILHHLSAHDAPLLRVHWREEDEADTEGWNKIWEAHYAHDATSGSMTGNSRAATLQQAAQNAVFGTGKQLRYSLCCTA